MIESTIVLGFKDVAIGPCTMTRKSDGKEFQMAAIKFQKLFHPVFNGGAIEEDNIDNKCKVRIIIADHHSIRILRKALDEIEAMDFINNDKEKIKE